MAKEYTVEEVREIFIAHVKQMVFFWEKTEGTEREKLEGVASSILSTLDGCASLPGFIVAPCPHPDDKQYAIDEDSDWFPQNIEAKVDCNIAGGLHELFYKDEREAREDFER